MGEEAKYNRQLVEHLPGLLTLYSDGSFERPSDLDLPPCLHFVDGVASKDVVLYPSTPIWARIFLPQLAAHGHTKLPLVLYFHGGGCCLGSPATSLFHNFCSRMAPASNSIWVSVNYRLAPEHRLPAAFDDAFSALLWLRSQARAQGDAGNGTEPWLSQHADFSRCFLAGESAGGIIAHYLAVRAAATEWSPIRIRGLLPIHAGFMLGKAVPSEEADKSDALMAFYKSALPPGAIWDHPCLNPVHPHCPKLSETDLPPVFVAVAERDVLREGGEGYYEELKKAGKEAELFESKAEGHCFHLYPPRSAAAEALEKKIIDFMRSLVDEL